MSARTNKQLKPLLVCFSHLRWDFVWQRPQHLLTHASTHFDVIFIEEPMMQSVLAPELSISSRAGGVRVAVPFLPNGLNHDQQVEAQRALAASLLASESRRPKIFWYYTPMAVAFSADLHRDLTVYDNMDELSTFRGASPELLEFEEKLLRQSDVVFTGGLSLYEAKCERHNNLYAFPSSIDVNHFARARGLRTGRSVVGSTKAKPCLGFFGVIDERLDMSLVDGVARLRPDWQIDMVGPVVKIDPASLPRQPNINWLGGCAYAELPDRLAAWDIGIMPFALNESTRFISPTKTPEFLAAGLRVVSTPIVDVVRTYGKSGLVEIAESALDFVAATDRLLAQPDQPWLARVDRQLATSSWSETWAAMHTLIRDAMLRPKLSAVSNLSRSPRSAARSGATHAPALPVESL